MFVRLSSLAHIATQAVDNKLLDRAFDIMDRSNIDPIFLCIVTDDTDMLPALQKVNNDNCIFDILPFL